MDPRRAGLRGKSRKSRADAAGWPFARARRGGDEAGRRAWGAVRERATRLRDRGAERRWRVGLRSRVAERGRDAGEPAWEGPDERGPVAGGAERARGDAGAGRVTRWRAGERAGRESQLGHGERSGVASWAGRVGLDLASLG